MGAGRTYLESASIDRGRGFLVVVSMAWYSCGNPSIILDAHCDNGTEESASFLKIIVHRDGGRTS